LHSTRVIRVLPYAPDQLFDLVGDVESYPKFLPWVSAVRAWNRIAPKDGVASVDAEAKVGFAFVKETFATRVKLDTPRRVIEVSLLYGPFKHLHNSWTFTAQSDGERPGARIDFEIDFEFKSRLLDAILAANLHTAAERLIACFEARARTLYGVPAVAG